MDINEGPDNPNLINFADHPYLPTTLFGKRNIVEAQPVFIKAQPVQANGHLFEAQPAFTENTAHQLPDNIMEVQPIEIKKSLFKDEDRDNFFSLPSLLVPPTLTTANTQSLGSGHPRMVASVSTRTTAGYVLSNVRPALLTAHF